MTDNLIESYNPLYDVHLRQYFALPHMQKHLRNVGLIETSISNDEEENKEVDKQHELLMEKLLRNREQVFCQIADLHKKLTATEKIEICRKIRNGSANINSNTSKRSHNSRSVSRPAQDRKKQFKSSRQRRHSNSFDENEVIKRIEADYNLNNNTYAKDIYNRLSASVYKYQYLHKLDDKTLYNYKLSLQKQLEKLKRFRELSFGINSITRHHSQINQTSWFFRRKSLPNIFDNNCSNKNLKNSKLNRKSRSGKPQAVRKISLSEKPAKNRHISLRSRVNQNKLPPLSTKTIKKDTKKTSNIKSSINLPPATSELKQTTQENYLTSRSSSETSLSSSKTKVLETENDILTDFDNNLIDNKKKNETYLSRELQSPSSTVTREGSECAFSSTGETNHSITEENCTFSKNNLEHENYKNKSNETVDSYSDSKISNNCDKNETTKYKTELLKNSIDNLCSNDETNTEYSNNFLNNNNNEIAKNQEHSQFNQSKTFNNTNLSNENIKKIDDFQLNSKKDSVDENLNNNKILVESAEDFSSTDVKPNSKNFEIQDINGNDKIELNKDDLKNDEEKFKPYIEDFNKDNAQSFKNDSNINQSINCNNYCNQDSDNENSHNEANNLYENNISKNNFDQEEFNKFDKKTLENYSDSNSLINDNFHTENKVNDIQNNIEVTSDNKSDLNMHNFSKKDSNNIIDEISEKKNDVKHLNNNNSIENRIENKSDTHENKDNFENNAIKQNLDYKDFSNFDNDVVQNNENNGFLNNYNYHTECKLDDNKIDSEINGYNKNIVENESYEDENNVKNKKFDETFDKNTENVNYIKNNITDENQLDSENLLTKTSNDQLFQDEKNAEQQSNNNYYEKLKFANKTNINNLKNEKENEDLENYLFTNKENSCLNNTTYKTNNFNLSDQTEEYNININNLQKENELFDKNLGENFVQNPNFFDNYIQKTNAENHNLNNIDNKANSYQFETNGKVNFIHDQTNQTNNANLLADKLPFLQEKTFNDYNSNIKNNDFNNTDSVADEKIVSLQNPSETDQSLYFEDVEKNKNVLINSNSCSKENNDLVNEPERQDYEKNSTTSFLSQPSIEITLASEHEGSTENINEILDEKSTDNEDDENLDFNNENTKTNYEYAQQNENKNELSDLDVADMSNNNSDNEEKLLELNNYAKNKAVNYNFVNTDKTILSDKQNNIESNGVYQNLNFDYKGLTKKEILTDDEEDSGSVIIKNEDDQLYDSDHNNFNVKNEYVCVNSQS